VLAGLVLLWLIYNASAFRLPWNPIVVSDSDGTGSTRQLLFSLACAGSLARLLATGGLGWTLGQRLPPLAFLGYLYLTLLVSDDPGLTFKRATVVTFGMLTLLGIVHASPRPVTSMQRLVALFTAGVAWVSLAAMLALPAPCSSIAEKPGLAGVSSHPNTLAPCLAVGALLTLGWTPETPRQALLRRVALLGAFPAIVLANSITSLLFTALGVAAFVILSSASYRRGAWLVGLTCGSTLAWFAYQLVGREAVFRMLGRDPSLSGRDLLWGQLLEIGLQRPFFGGGFGAFWREGRGRELVHTWNPRQSHHAYLDAFLDLGGVGLALLVLLLVPPIWRAWREQRGEAGSPRRRAVASMCAMGLGLLTLYANGEAFLLKLDKVPFLILLWIVLLLSNRDHNRLEVELSPLSQLSDCERTAELLPPTTGPPLAPAAS
jgi:O-antigen ligase